MIVGMTAYERHHVKPINENRVRSQSLEMRDGENVSNLQKVLRR